MDQVDKYISNQPSPQKEILQQIRHLIRQSGPQAQESMSYGVPAFKLGGKSFMYAAFKNHIGIYPSPDIIKAYEKKLNAYETSKGTIKFPIDKPIPYTLIKKIFESQVSS